MRHLIAAALVVTLVSGTASASVTPRPEGNNPRIQVVDYNPLEVVILRSAVGFALTLRFGDDERIENVAIGNSGAWQVTPNKDANLLILKPQSAASPTNMTVTTSGRTYYFELVASSAPDPSMPYAVRFLYPVTSVEAVIEQEILATRYVLSGARDLRPLSMSDDGKATIITWIAGAPLPAIYIVGSDGREALVNGGMRGGAFVIDQVGERFVFRLGDRKAEAERKRVKASR